MRIPGFQDSHLTYCLNIHAGERWEENLQAIRDHVPRIRAAVAPSEAFGLGLRISHAAALSLQDPGQRAAFRSFLERQNLYVFTLNGFPYGTFHQSVVKTNVYAPDWRTRERVDYTIRLADLLADWLPPGISGSISTVPCSYKPWIRTTDDVALMTRHLTDVVAHLMDIRRRTGQEIHLGLEPEPDCFLETTAEFVEWYEHIFLPDAVAGLTSRLGVTSSEAETAARTHLGLCFDTCHLALQFEDLRTSLATLRSHGIRVSKIQISSALRVESPLAARERLRAFCDPVYLHQVKTRTAAGVVSRGDLTDVLARPPDPADGAWRIHFHVPLYFSGTEPLMSTRDDVADGFLSAAAVSGVRHFEIETYTFDVLPPEARERDLDHSIVREFEWVLGQFASSPTPGHDPGG